MRTPIGECLRNAGILTDEQLQHALDEQKRSGERLGSVLVRVKLATERQVAKALACQLGLDYVDLVEHPPAPAAVAMIPKDVAVKRTCIALAAAKNLLTVAMSDQLNLALVQDLEFQTGYRVKQVVAAPSEIIEAIGAWYSHDGIVCVSPARTQPEGRAADSARRSGKRQLDVSELTRRREDELFEHSAAPHVETDGTAPIVDMVDLVVKSALKSRASDIHIEPFSDHVKVRFRIEGVLQEMPPPDKSIALPLISRLKIISKMDIS